MEIREHEIDGITVLGLHGKLLRGDAEGKLKDRIAELIASRRIHIVLNLRDVPYVDSSGLGEIVRSHTLVRRSGGRLGLTHLNRRLVDLLTITKLSDIFPVYETDEDAVRGMKRK
jgi:anti-sigma B factor antagonist